MYKYNNRITNTIFINQSLPNPILISTNRNNTVTHWPLDSLKKTNTTPHSTHPIQTLLPNITIPSSNSNSTNQPNPLTPANNPTICPNHNNLIKYQQKQKTHNSVPSKLTSLFLPNIRAFKIKSSSPEFNSFNRLSINSKCTRNKIVRHNSKIIKIR